MSQKVPIKDSEFRADGNIFAVLGVATRALKRAGKRQEAAELATQIWEQPSYEKALALILDYVDVLGDDDFEAAAMAALEEEDA